MALKMRRQMHLTVILAPHPTFPGPAQRGRIFPLWQSSFGSDPSSWLSSFCRRSRPVACLLHLVPAREAGDPEPQGVAQRRAPRARSASGRAELLFNAQTCCLRDLADCLVCLPDRQAWRRRSPRSRNSPAAWSFALGLNPRHCHEDRSRLLFLTGGKNVGKAAEALLSFLLFTFRGGGKRNGLL
jgi:hypothetical protein